MAQNIRLNIKMYILVGVFQQFLLYIYFYKIADESINICFFW
jgi:hypothetical protein